MNNENFASLASQLQYADSMKNMFEDIYRSNGFGDKSLITLKTDEMVPNISIRKCL